MARKAKSLEIWCHENSRQELLDEWNDEKNISFNRTPEIEYNAPSRVYWKCHRGHEWECPVASRTLFDLNCPICNPEMESLPIGTEYGCLTIIEKVQNEKKDFYYSLYGPTYRCRCKCGKIDSFSEFNFLEKRHRYCTGKIDDMALLLHPDLADKECGLRKKQKEDLLASYERVYDESYDVDFSNTFHESLEILECVDDHYEQLHSYHDKRKKGGGTYKVYKLYKCRCYLCGKEQTIKSSQFSINPPTEYGYRAYGGYYSEAYCDCHKISSFQWIVTKILTENNVPYRVEVTFPDLYGTEHINLLRYDFSVLNNDGSIKCLIECQGEQHFKPVDEFGGKAQFEIQKKNDDLKRIYANDHGIPLYEIPYKSKKYDNVELFLKSKNII